MKEKKKLTSDQATLSQDSTTTSITSSSPPMVSTGAQGNTKSRVHTKSKHPVPSSPLSGTPKVDDQPYRSISTAIIDVKDKEPHSLRQADICVSLIVPKIPFLHPELTATYIRTALQGNLGSSEYDNCSAWIAKNKYQPHAAQILSILAKLTTQQGYDQALQAFWSTLCAPPHDITHKAHIRLIVYCLESARCDSRIPRRDWLLQEVNLWVSQDTRKLYFNKKENDFLWALLAQNPFVLKQTSILEKLLSALGGQESIIRSGVQNSAAEALGKLGPAAATTSVLTALATILKNREYSCSVRGNAAFALGQMGIAAVTSKILTTLIATLMDENIEVRIKSAQALGRLGVLTTWADKIMAALVQAALREEESFARCAIAIALKSLQEAANSPLAPLLVTALQDTKPYVRANAAEILGQLRIVAVMPQILELLLFSLKDENPYVRAQVTAALGQLGAAAAKKKVAIALSNALLKDTELGVKVLAAQALAQLNITTVIPRLLGFLVRVLQSKEWFSRFYASQAFCVLGPIANTAEVSAALTAALQDKNRLIRLNAVKALGHIGLAAATPETVSALIAILEDDEPDLHIHGARIHTHVLTLKCHAAKTLGQLGTVATTPKVLDLLASVLNEWQLGGAAAEVLNTLITPKTLELCTDPLLTTCNNKNVYLAGIPLSILIERYLFREAEQQKAASECTRSNPWLPFVIRQIENSQVGIVLNGNILELHYTHTKFIPFQNVSLLRTLFDKLDTHYAAKGLPFRLYLNPPGPSERSLSSPSRNPEVTVLFSPWETKGVPSDRQLSERQAEPMASVEGTSISTITPLTQKSSQLDQPTLYEQLLNATIQWSQKTGSGLESKQVSIHKKKEKENSIEMLKKCTASYGYDLESNTGSQSDSSNNFYQAVSNQLWRQLSILISPETLRDKAVDHMLKNLGLYTTSVTENMKTFIDRMSQPGTESDAVHRYALSRALHISLAIIPNDGIAPNVYRRNKPSATAYLGYAVGKYYHSLVPQVIGGISRLDLIIQSTRIDPLYLTQSSQNDLKHLGVMLAPILSSNEKDKHIKAFLLAINRGDDQIVKACLEQDLSPTALSSSWSIAPIFLAAYAGSVPVMKVLVAADLTGELLKQKDTSGNTTLFIAARSGRIAAVRWLHEQGISGTAANEDGHTPLSVAISYGHVAVVKYLLLTAGAVLTKDVSVLATAQPMKDYLLQYTKEQLDSFASIHQQLMPKTAQQESAPTIPLPQEFSSTNTATAVTASSSVPSIVSSQVLITQGSPQNETLIPSSLPKQLIETDSSSPPIQLSEHLEKKEEKRNSFFQSPITNPDNLLPFSSEPDSAFEPQIIEPFKQKLKKLMDSGYTFSITKQHAGQLALRFTAVEKVFATHDDIRRELVETGVILQELLNNSGITVAIGQFKADWKQWTLTILAEPKDIHEIAKLLHMASLPYLSETIKKKPGFFPWPVTASGSGDSASPDYSESKGYSCLIM